MGEKDEYRSNDIPIDVNFGGSGLGNLLDLAEKLAAQKGDDEAKQKVATLRGVLGGDKSAGESEGTGPVISSGVNFGGIFKGLLGGGEEGGGIGIGNILGGGEGEGAGGGGIGSIFSLVERMTVMAQNLKGVGGEGGDGTQEFTVPGGGQAVFHVETGGGHSTLQKRMADADSRVEPTVVKSGNVDTEIVEQSPEKSTEVVFALEPYDTGDCINVCGSISGVTDPDGVTCTVIEDGTQLQVAVPGNVYTVDLPEQVDTEGAEANFNNGVFTIVLKKVTSESEATSETEK